ncbi:sodium-dependent transporter [Marinomonas mediterranea]|uniref:sodium-dependent transporter n=1 Tax=Marinomonas mediterranea TaxID=119864 RepID=UPI0023492822|nr:sodium-dependent transporter [Marinomonas mediterranea]WCN07941.1 sodium-dependent transporter [Marinomonas mediterranea]WCN12036.1 sodium-dependent transporter [Marinomonas mediterranea]
MTESRCLQGIWSSPWIFIFAASGAAIGLGNVWKFPYMMAENGGAAFLFVYCLCLLFVALPIVIAEVAIGRTVRSNPIDTVNDLSERRLLHPAWVLAPWLAGITGVLIMTFYSVIAGWTLAYFERAITGLFTSIGRFEADVMYQDLLDSPVEMLFWHTLFMVLVVLTVGQSVTRGLATLVKVLLPVLITFLFLLAIYAFSVGDSAEALDFMLVWSWGDFSFDMVLSAIGHALFSVGVGLGAMFSYGAYMNKRMSISRACSIVVGLDLLVSLLAVVVIFPLAFEFNIDVDSGPSLAFVTLPIVFGALPGGQVIGASFFILLAIAALTSAIAMMELFVSWLHEKFYIGRLKAASMLGAFIWLVGIAILLSFNHWDAKLLFNKNLFELMDALTSFILLPLVATLIAVMVGWFVPEKMLRREMITQAPQHFDWWYKILKFVSIPLIGLITVAGWIGV